MSDHTRLFFVKCGSQRLETVSRPLLNNTFVELVVSSLGSHGNTTCSTEGTAEYPQHDLGIDQEGSLNRELKHL